MAQAAIATDFHQALDIRADQTAQIAFHGILTLDRLAQAADLFFRQIAYPRRRTHAAVFEDELTGRQPDPVNIGQGDLDTLVSG